MRVWLIKIGEPLPTDETGDRLMRMGILAETLVSAGHEVLWWTGAFDHARKRHRFDEDTAVDVNDSYRIFLLHSMGYRRNVSLSRVLDHRQVARKFARLAHTESQPDLILCSLPIPGLCLAAAKYGRKNGVPVVIDVRDLWPDVFLNLVPRWAQGCARVALWPMRRTVRSACSKATAICGVTSPFMDWGVRHAGRQRTPLDRDFPHGYTEKSPDKQAIEKAYGFWAKYGITRQSEEFTACFFGRMGHQFELDTVIEAARVLQEDERPFRFVLCGSGDKLEHYKNLAAGLESVIFPGWVGSAEIWTLLRMSAVGLAPYYNIGNFTMNLPNKPIEYLSAGLPVVSGLKGVLQDLLARYDCGITYENGNAEELASVLRDLYNHPEHLRKMSANGRALFEERFVAEKVYCEMADYLKEVVDACQAGR